MLPTFGLPPTQPPISGSTPKPSAYPTRAPSARPTATPTALPTTPMPTAAPTVYLGDFWRARYQSELGMIESNASGKIVAVYGESRFGDDILTGGCNAWGSFLYSDLAVLAAQRRVKSIVMHSLTSLTNALSTTSLGVHPCDASANASESIIQELVAAVPAPKASMADIYPPGSSGSVSCGFYYWQLAYCGNNATKRYTPALCINCPFSTGFCDEGACDDLLIAPCEPARPSCTGDFMSQNRGMIRFLVVEFFPPVPAPVILSMTAIEVHKSNFTARLTLNGNGKVRCGLYQGSGRPSSIGSIERQFVGGKSVNNVTDVLFRGLLPASEFTMYCLTESIDHVTSTLTQVTSSYPSLSVMTSCCKMLGIDVLFKSALPDTSIPKALHVHLNAAPSGSLQLSVSFLFQKLNETNIQWSNKFFPSGVTYSASTHLHSDVSFQGHDIPDHYRIVPVLTGSAAASYEAVFVKGAESAIVTILEDNSEPVSPVLLSARFSDNGGGIILLFDSATNSAGLGQKPLSCRDYLAFPGNINDSKCRFSGDGIRLFVVLTAANVTVGDTVSILDNNVKAKCTISNCSSWSYINGGSAVIKEPEDPVIPVVALTASSTIGSCDDYLLDMSSSYGNGGRMWSSVSFVVSSSDSTISSYIAGLQAYLDANYTVNDMSPPTTVPKELFSAGHPYSFQVQLCNFLNSCGESSINLVVLNNVLPSVTLLAAPLMTRRRSNALAIKSAAFTANCDGSKTLGNIQYNWEVYDDGTLDNSIQTESVNDQSIFRLSAYTLFVGHTYTVQVTAVNTVTVTAASASTNIFIIIDEIEARIAGGATQSIRQGDGSLVLDASGSRNLDCNTAACNSASLKYSWSCFSVAPVFSATCPLVTVNGSATSQLTIDVDPVYLGYTARVEVTVVDNGESRVASASVLVNILYPTAPVVDISVNIAAIGSVTKFDVSDRLLVFGKVKATNPGYAVWSVDDPELTLDPIVPINVTFPTTVTAAGNYKFVNLYLNRDNLFDGSTYTFSLTCNLNTGATSFATFEISTNGPPAPGTFDVSPATGEELITDFTFSAALWVDDDLPLTYSFWFGNDVATAFSIRSRSQTPYTTATLAAGAEFSGFSVNCFARVFDSMDAGNQAMDTVVVNPMAENTTLLAILVAEQLSSSAGDVDGTSQAISTSAAVLNAVNCTLAPNCTMLLRSACYGTSHTCGECLWDSELLYQFTGASGDSNDECVDPNAAVTGAQDGTCTQQSDCSGFDICNTASNLCETPSKRCQQDCSGNGVCLFEDVVDKTAPNLSDCLMGDIDCDATCQCDTGYGGSACQYTEADLADKRQLRLQLLLSLLSLSNSQDATEEIIVLLLRQLTALIRQFDQLDNSAVDPLVSLSQTILNYAVQVGVSSDVITNVLDAIDAASKLLQEEGDSGTSRRRRLNTADQIAALQTTHDIVRDYVSIQQRDMVFGEAESEYIAETFRFTTAVVLVDSSAEYSVDIPRTSLEVLAGKRVSSLDVLLVNEEINDDPTFSFSVVSIDSVNSTNQNSDLFEMISTSQQPCIPTLSEPCKVTVTLQNLSPATTAVPYGTPFSTTNCSLSCEAGDTTSTNVCFCDDSGSNFMILVCSGVETVYTSFCQSTSQIQTCNSIVIGTGAVDDPVCDTIDYNEDNITCSCIAASADTTDTNANYVSMLETDSRKDSITVLRSITIAKATTGRCPQ